MTRYWLLVCLALGLALPADDVIPAIVLADFEDGYMPGLGGEARQPESKLSLVDSPVHSGTKAAKLNYVFRKDGSPRQYVEVWINRALPGSVQSVSAWIHGDGSKQMLKLRACDAGDEWLQYRYGLIDWKGWKQVTITLDKSAFEVSWGGDENRKPDGPLKRVCFLVDSAVNPADSALVFDDVTYSALGDPLDFVTVKAKSKALGNAFYGTAPTFAVQVANGLDAPQQDLPVSLRVLDGEGNELSKVEQTVALGAKETVEFALSPSLADFGLYRAVVSLRGRETAIPFSYLPSADTTEPDLASPFGVSMHFGHGGRGPLENNLKLASDMGIRWLRDDASWGSVEHEKGVYKVPPTFDRFLRSARKDWGCELMIILDYDNRLYCPERAITTDEQRQAFANWAEYMAREYRDSVTYWEVWNEPNIAGFWKPAPNAKDYALLLKAAYEGVKRGNPDAQVVAMVTAGIDQKYIDKVLSEGTVGYFDAISVHPYRYPTAPEEGSTTMLEHFGKLIDVLAKHGVGDTPIYNTEVGWPNQEDPRGLPEATSAAYLARMYVQLHSIPQIRSTFWYDFQNDGLKRDYNENNFGLLHNDFSPKAPAVAYRMSTLALEGRRYVGELDTKNDNTRAYLFAGEDGTQIVAAWSIAGAGALNLDWDTSRVQAISAAGPIRDLTVRRGALAVELGMTPVFLVAKGDVALAKATLSGEGGWTVPGRAVALDLAIRNPFALPIAGPINVTAPEGWTVRGGLRVLLDRRESMVRMLTVQPSADAEVGKTYQVSCRWLNDRGEFLGAVSLPVEVRAAAAVSLQYDTKTGELALAGTSPLAEPPVIQSATVSFQLPEGTEESRDVSDALSWSRKGLGGTSAFAAALACPAPVAAPTVATVKVAFADVPAVEAETAYNLWPVPIGGVVVDGKDEDWLGVTSVPVTAFDGTMKEKWSGAQDASATVSMVRDLEALYLYVTVIDDVQRQDESGGNVWRGDGIQLSLAPVEGSPEERVEIGLTLTKTGPEAFRWTQESKLLDDVSLKIVREGTATRYEAAIPWSELGGCPEAGSLRRFALVVNDQDDKEREGWLYLFKGLGWSKDASKHGLLKF